MSLRTSPTLLAALALVALVLPAPALAQGTAKPVSVRVTMSERACSALPKRPRAGAAIFKVRNAGKRARSFSIAGRRSRFVKPRRTATLRASLGKGRIYRFTCTAKGKPRSVRSGTLRVAGKASPTRPSRPQPPPPAPQPQPPAPPPPPPPPPAPPPPNIHRIGVRPAGGSGELYHLPSGTTFVARGANYARFGVPAGESTTQDVTFNVGTYDAAAADQTLVGLASGGYNAVRVFLNGGCATGCLGDPSTADDLSGAYVANVVDFLGKARAKGIQVIVVADGVPVGTSYAATVAAACCAQFAGENLDFLTAGGVTGNADFWRALALRLTAQAQLRETILSYELRRRSTFRTDQAPLSLASGTVTAANGQAYDLAVPARRQALMDESLAYWADQVRAAVKGVDSTALVSLGFDLPSSPRVSRLRHVLDNGAVDFVSLQAYPGLGLTLADQVAAYELPAVTSKPVLMAEAGAPTAAYPPLYAAAEALQTWQAQSCPAGFDGWLLWTWDSTGQLPGEPAVWNGAAGGGLLQRALAPSLRPNPCSSPNVALGKPTTASSSGVGTPAADAVDGLVGTLWNAGGPPGGWIELDLGAPYDVAMLRLVVAQTPAGLTEHTIEGKPTLGDPYVELQHVFQSTSDGQLLEFTPASPWGSVRYLRVRTIWGPSWPAWREIEVFPSF
ncbi:MAG TPA: discoidin domain-containing protein [Gaiellaceae bacterium]|nr:discoidin domain-containing protein [Gaiellaceae bacterium]